MTDPTTWNTVKKEEHLKRLFEKVEGTFAEEGGGEFLEVEFANETEVYQYMPTCHNVTGMDGIIEQYELDVIDRGNDRSTLESLVSGIKGVFSSDVESETEVVEWVTACHGGGENGDEVYTVFTAIRETVYGYSLSGIESATIIPNTSEDPISWTDV